MDFGRRPKRKIYIYIYINPEKIFIYIHKNLHHFSRRRREKFLGALFRYKSKKYPNFGAAGEIFGRIYIYIYINRTSDFQIGPPDLYIYIYKSKKDLYIIIFIKIRFSIFWQILNFNSGMGQRSWG